MRKKQDGGEEQHQRQRAQERQKAEGPKGIQGNDRIPKGLWKLSKAS